MYIGIIGYGVVGKALAYGFKKLGHTIYIYDIAYKEYSDIVPLLVCDITFVALPTPMNEDGSCDTSIVEQVLDYYIHGGYKGIIAIKSTVPIGTTDKLIQKYPYAKICHNPELLKERYAMCDMKNQDICLIGTDDDFIFNILAEFHKPFVKKIIRLKTNETEAAKYFNNSL